MLEYLRFSPFSSLRGTRSGIATVALLLIVCGDQFSVSRELQQVEAKKERLRFELSVPAMGSMVDMVVYAELETKAKAVMDAGLSEIERLSLSLSNYDANSEISRLCLAPHGSSTKIGSDLSAVLMESQRWHRLSEGKFDITVGPLTQLWRTHRHRKELPSSDLVSDARQRCGWSSVRLDSPSDIALLKPNMVLDLSGIAVGYILDRAFEKMAAAGSRQVLINAGGDIRMGDAPPASDGWRITIAGLGKKSPPLAMLRIQNGAVATSGDLNQYIEIDGHRYSHFIDPDSGTPIERRQSVTAIAATAVDADAGATALAVLGMQRASDLFETLPLQEAIFMVADQSDSAPFRMRWLKNE